jgi:hypothetical protein
MSLELKSNGKNHRARRVSVFRSSSEFPAQVQLESAPRQLDPYQCFRNVLKTSRENRIWGTVELKESVKECIDVLSKIYPLDRLDEDCLQKILMICEFVVLRKPHILFEAGQEQTYAFLILSGSLILKSGSSSSWEQDTGGGENDLPVLNAMDSIGLKSLFSDWGEWPVGCIAGSNKVEVYRLLCKDCVLFL